MPTTTVHIPPKLLKALDALATRKKASRNRLVVEACERLVRSNRGEWPAGFLEAAHLSARDRRELEATGKALDAAVQRVRRNRRRDPFGRAGS
jgi:metal-responsive CopG/Arc/MetJ family transcriptional regulator